jgi:hypothetical protein
MKNFNDLQNRGESILSISGGETGVQVMLIGEKDRIIKILKNALNKSSALREILKELNSGESGKDQCLEDHRRPLDRKG